MKLNNVIFVIAIYLKINLIYGQNEVLRCAYSINLLNGYRCDLTIINPNGFNNFTTIDGTHLFLRTDSDVRYITGSSESYSLNIPSIICEKFSNTLTIEFLEMGVQRVDEDSFINCKNLSYLDLKNNKINRIHENSFKENIELAYLFLWFNEITNLPEKIFSIQNKLQILDFESNKISNLSENVFKSLRSLRLLYLENNLIDELPKNIFNDLRNLTSIWLDNNNLKIIHADSFGFLPNLKAINLHNNKVEAIDDRFINNTGVATLNLINNKCYSNIIIDITPQRLFMRTALRECFKNYEQTMFGKFFDRLALE